MSVLKIIPNRNEIDKSMQLSQRFGCAFEYNDFFIPDVLDDGNLCRNIIRFYKSLDRDRRQDTLHGAFLDLAPHSNDSKIREVTKSRVYQCLDIAADLGIRGVIFHTGLLSSFRDPLYLSNWLAANTEFYKKAAADYPGLDIYLENMFDRYPDMFVAFGEATKDIPNISLCLDIAHAFLSGHPIEEWIDLAAPYTKHMHVNDNDGKDDLHLALGDGVIPWNSVLNTLSRKELLSSASILVECSDFSAQERSLEFLKNHGF